MVYIQLSEKHAPKGFLVLAKSGTPVTRLPNNTYRVTPEHLKLLASKKIPFRKLRAPSVRVTTSSTRA